MKPIEEMTPEERKKFSARLNTVIKFTVNRMLEDRERFIDNGIYADFLAGELDEEAQLRWSDEIRWYFDEDEILQKYQDGKLNALERKVWWRYIQEAIEEENGDDDVRVFAPEEQIKTQFTYIRMDKLAAARNWNPDRECMACGKIIKLSDEYTLTPIDLSWFVKTKDPKAFGLCRCYDCIPTDAIEAGEHLRRKKLAKEEDGEK